jgi:3'-phosphoadenosine 5'-phosphosulfate sulfotransferase (PAPS reductase)/FAD synthetase
MTDPFLITGPALISFSGGRTSAKMLKKTIDRHGGTLPDDVYVAFANTGKEREETLRFVHECGSRWGVKIHWLEFVTDLKRGGAASRFVEVGYNSASRNGEPLERLIARKKAIFSTQSGRWCTEFCKVGVLQDFMETLGYRTGEYTEVIGFRADERDRVIEMPSKPRNAHRRFAFPLADAGIRKADVFAFWDEQPFDLQLERGLGNCDQCPFLAFKARVIRARRDPATVPWWAKLEGRFDYSFGRESFAEVQKAARESALLPLDDIEQDAADSECSGWCGEAA